MVMDKLKEALEQKNDSSIEANIKVLKEVFNDIHNKDYDHEVDRKVAKALLPLYAEMIPAGQRPAIYDVIEKEYKGDYNAYVDAMYDTSILANQANFDKFIITPASIQWEAKERSNTIFLSSTKNGYIYCDKNTAYNGETATVYLVPDGEVKSLTLNGKNITQTLSTEDYINI